MARPSPLEGKAARPDLVRAEVVYEGFVQGVGFRATACYTAQSFKVTGYVMNTPGETVELAAEGERQEVEKFLETLGERMARHIRHATVVWRKATGEFDGFDVRY